MIDHPKINFYGFDSGPDMAFALSTRILKSLQNDLTTTGSASWAVSGGSTPKPLFEKVSNTEFDWHKVDIALVDERWVPQAHSRSNESFVKNTLLVNEATSARFTGMFVEGKSHRDALPFIENAYGKITYPFTSVLLGLGNDGHTASLFPEADGLEHALACENTSICAALTARKSTVTGDEVERITITFHAINRAKDCILMITGDEKLGTLKEALSNDINLPIARVINSMKQPLNVFWAP
ncbi:6-phosphogluconolactonase [Kordiimonas sp. SCSIO 12610]|uniref:6-phosphogluconolactonase n=1 Tax=Kordiimonas sp. SCSIO 12610 TaxID=2829597 RepID=UPI00210B2DC8|nr:6-phosphogluconolactonase [Kordiimonas sp. SCSIO 12610]UTW55843.1 6-phosphogluconolactonase [Kordiimonas sp. SCSIO 12610]